MIDIVAPILTALGKPAKPGLSRADIATGEFLDLPSA
jgi:hypothetical protein